MSEPQTPERRVRAPRGRPLPRGSRQFRTLRAADPGLEFWETLRKSDLWPLKPVRIRTLQVNLGRLCNQECRHCHVNAGPDRTEVMTRETMERCLAALEKTEIGSVDLTGGAPELNPHFRWFVERCRALGRHVIDRCNLSVLGLAGQHDLAEFLAANRVEVVCSLPHFRALNTDRIRGEGAFTKSIEGLKRLNGLGYGDGKSGLRLVVVANPAGAFLPGNQSALERDFRQELARSHGIVFDSLYCMTNMPIGRFLEWLEETSNVALYMERLRIAFNPAAAANVMCRSLVSVGWDGRLYDCDFNQVLDVGVDASVPGHIAAFDLEPLEGRPIVVGPHCFGCTAGGGSSCGGVTV